MQYLSNNSLFKLDEVIKKFEVAFRSYISEEITSNFSNEKIFYDTLEQLSKVTVPSI